VDTEEEVVRFESRATPFRNGKLDKKSRKEQESIELGRMLEGLS
jgi:hypothetical protein